MQLAGTFAFQQRYKSTEILEVEGVIAAGSVVTMPDDGTVHALLVWWWNACELTQTAVAWNITL